MDIGLALGRLASRLPWVTDLLARSKYKSQMKARAEEIKGDKLNDVVAKEYDKARQSLVEQFPPTEAGNCAVQGCPYAAAAPAAGKAERRRQRKALIERAREAAHFKNDPDALAAADRLERDMDGVEKARLAKHVYLKYDPDEHGLMPADLKALRDSAPEGFLPASDEELAQMGLDPSDLAPDDLNFRAAVYKYDPAVWGPEYTNRFTVATRGTTRNLEDWENNMANGGDKDSAYYKAAKTIGSKIANSPMADRVEATGHSLGGGLAQAIHAGSGGVMKTTTFNSAGVHDSLANRYNIPGAIDESRIEAYRVKGELLTQSQETGIAGWVAPDAKGRKIDIEPADPALRGVKLSDAQSEDLHGMDNTIAAIESQKTADEAILNATLANPGLVGDAPR